jgi:hypothetical protein
LVANLGTARTLEISQKNILLDAAGRSRPCSENDVNCSDKANAAPDRQPVEGAAAPQAAAIPETVRYLFPGAFRSDIVAPPADRTHIFSRGRAVTVIDGTISGNPESYFDFYQHLLLHRSRTAFISTLIERGVDPEVTSLGRFEGQTAFVIGAQYPDTTFPQVWIDKETLLPMRWIVQGANPGEKTVRFEIRYLDWRQTGRIRYPDQIEFLRNGTPVRLIQVENIVLNSQFGREMFNIDDLLARSQPAAASPEQVGRKGGLSDIQKAIEEFRRLFD